MIGKIIGRRCVLLNKNGETTSQIADFIPQLRNVLKIVIYVKQLREQQSPYF